MTTGVYYLGSESFNLAEATPSPALLTVYGLAVGHVQNLGSLSLVHMETPAHHSVHRVKDLYSLQRTIVIAAEPGPVRPAPPVESVEELRVDTDRVVTLAQGVQEWDRLTRPPSRENVLLPADLEG